MKVQLIFLLFFAPFTFASTNTVGGGNNFSAPINGKSTDNQKSERSEEVIKNSISQMDVKVKSIELQMSEQQYHQQLSEKYFQRYKNLILMLLNKNILSSQSLQEVMNSNDYFLSTFLSNVKTLDASILNSALSGLENEISKKLNIQDFTKLCESFLKEKLFESNEKHKVKITASEKTIDVFNPRLYYRLEGYSVVEYRFVRLSEKEKAVIFKTSNNELVLFDLLNKEIIYILPLQQDLELRFHGLLKNNKILYLSDKFNKLHFYEVSTGLKLEYLDKINLIRMFEGLSLEKNLQGREILIVQSSKYINSDYDENYFQFYDFNTGEEIFDPYLINSKDISLPLFFRLKNGEKAFAVSTQNGVNFLSLSTGKEIVYRNYLFSFIKHKIKPYSTGLYSHPVIYLVELKDGRPIIVAMRTNRVFFINPENGKNFYSTLYSEDDMNKDSFKFVALPNGKNIGVLYTNNNKVLFIDLNKGEFVHDPFSLNGKTSSKILPVHLNDGRTIIILHAFGVPEFYFIDLETGKLAHPVFNRSVSSFITIKDKNSKNILLIIDHEIKKILFYDLENGFVFYQYYMSESGIHNFKLQGEDFDSVEFFAHVDRQNFILNIHEFYSPAVEE